MCVDVKVVGSVGSLDQLVFTADRPRPTLMPPLFAQPRPISLPIAVLLSFPAGTTGSIDISVEGQSRGQTIASAPSQSVSISAAGRGGATFSLVAGVDSGSDGAVADLGAADLRDGSPSDSTLPIDGLGADQAMMPDLVTSDSATPPDLISAPDLACSQAVCVDPAPTGWTGPVELYEGPPAGSPSCGGSYPLTRYSGNAGLNVSAGACTQCQWLPPSNTDCSTGLYGYNDASCQTLNAFGAGAFSSSCTSGPASNGLYFYATTAGYSGPCRLTSPATPIKTAPTWSTHGVACGFPTLTGGCSCPCSAGKVCATLPAPPFTANKLCVLSAGDMPCPGEPYTEKHLFFGATDDTRDCSPCTAKVNDNTCTATFAAYPNSTCSGSPTFTFADDASMSGQCHSTGTVLSVTMLNVAFQGAITCTSGGGTPTGTVTGAQPTTVCCTP